MFFLWLPHLLVWPLPAFPASSPDSPAIQPCIQRAKDSFHLLPCPERLPCPPVCRVLRFLHHLQECIYVLDASS